MPEKTVKKLSKKAFEEIVIEYHKANKKKKEFEKILEKFKPDIKAHIKTNGSYDEGTEKYELTTTSNFCELRPKRKDKSEDEKVAILKKAGIKGCTKRVEIVDTEALETAHLQGEVSEKVLKSMQNTTHALYVR